MSTIVQELRTAFSQNPILAKDTLLAGRRPTALIGAVLVIFALAFAVGIAVVAGLEEATRLDARPETFGRALHVGITLLVLALQGVLLPVLASTVIAAERERGTLDLLTTSALSPGRIVAGKLGGVIYTWIPYALLAAPFFALPMWAGEVSLVDCAAAFALVLFNGVVLIAGGLLCSAYAQRTRTASSMAFVLAFAVLWPLVVGPSMGLVAAGLDESARDSVAPFYVLVAVAGLALAAHAIVAARGRLSPRVVAHRLYRWRVSRIALLAVPLALALSTTLIPEPVRDAEAWVHLLTLPAVLLLVVLVVFEVAVSGGRAADAVSPARAAFLASRQATLGLVVASPVLALSLPVISADTRLGLALFVPVVGALYLATCGAIAAVVARLTEQVVLRVVLTSMIIGGLALLPVAGLIVHEVLYLDTSALPLAWTNPLVIIGAGADLFGDHVEFFDLRPRHVHASVAFIGPLFYAALLGLLSIPLALRRR